MKIAKRLTAMLLTLVLTMGLLPGVAIHAHAAELDYPVIELDVETMAKITESNGFAYFQFTPEMTHNYTFTSLYDGFGDDPQGYLYDSEMNELAFNDDMAGSSYGERNFSITYTMEAGTTYILGCRYYNEYRIGEYPVILKAEHDVEGVVTTEPTCTVDGVMTYTCKHCDYSYTEAIPAAHKYENGFCIVCGEEQIYSGECGEDVTWTLNGSGKLTITGTGAMYDYHPYYTPAPWTEYIAQIKSVEIGEGVTTVGDYAFSGCTGLTEAVVPSSVTSINDSAFRDCAGLTSITLSDGLSTIEVYAFDGCTSLPQVEIPDTVTSIGGNAFADCTSLAELKIGQSVSSIGSFAFFNCSGLTKVVLPDSVTDIGRDIFHDCANLAEVKLSAGLNEIPDCAFAGTSLTEVIFPDGILRIGASAFQDCTKLANVQLPENLTVIDSSAFKNCALVEVEVPESVVTFNDSAFAYCTNLRKINIPEGMSYMLYSMFEGCSSLERVVIPSTVTDIDQNVFSYCTSLKVIVFTGNAPSNIFEAFVDVVADVYYPGNDETWTEDIMQNYGGTLTWHPMCPEGKHTFTEWEVTKAATCTEKGEQTRTCRSCGYPDVADIDALGHSPALINVKEPTATEEGYTGDEVCTVCHAILQVGQVIPALGTCQHETALVGAKEATCTEDGYTGDEVCTLCGETVATGEVIPALGHRTELVNAKEATCTEDGYTGDEVCTVCGETIKTGEVIPANCPSKAFSDLCIDCWYHPYTDYVLSAGFMNGMSSTSFAPNHTLTRGMLITTLYRLAGEPEVTQKSTFTDLPANAYYEEAVAWAQANGIAKGVTGTTFCPEKAVTREQAATFLYRYVTVYLKQEAKEGADLNRFKDGGATSKFAQDAMAWAVAEELFEGFPDNTLQPKESMTRAQMAKLLTLLDQNF